jgi:flagella basal body P-ring formation protein FlgA
MYFTMPLRSTTAMTDRTSGLSQVMLAVFATFAAAFLASLPTPAQAQNFENLDRLDGLVAMSVGANLREPGGPVAPIDRRLRLAPCPQTPIVDATQPSFAVVSCTSIGWRIRVPLLPGQNAPQQTTNFAPSRAIAAPARTIVVKKGDPVQLIAGNDQFTISRLMIADEDGAAGTLIRVRQDAKATPVMARVETIGVVRIPGI